MITAEEIAANIDRIAARANGDAAVSIKHDATIVRSNGDRGPSRTAECAGCGVTFQIAGRGRTPKYHDSDCRATHERNGKGRGAGAKPLRGAASEHRPRPSKKVATPTVAASIAAAYSLFLLDRLEASPTSPERLERLLAFDPDPTDETLDRIEAAIGGAA